MTYTVTTTAAILFIVLALWDIAWKYLALWHAAQRNQLVWFTALLLINSAGILPITYLLVSSRDTVRRISFHLRGRPS